MNEIKWFRFHWKFLHDGKVQRLPLEQFKILVNLLCYACKVGNVSWNVSETLFYLGYNETECNASTVSSAFHVFVELGILTQRFDGVTETFHFTNWNKYQYKSDSSTDRVRKFRDKNKQKVKRFMGVTRNVTETHTETETDISKTNSFSAHAREKKKTQLVNFLGKDRAIPQAWKKTAHASLGWNDEKINTCYDKFFAYYAKKEIELDDWDSQWEFWCSRERTEEAKPTRKKQPANRNHAAYREDSDKIAQTMKKNSAKAMMIADTEEELGW